ncbi:MAG: threonine--tRNA ligase, partial [Bryobacteraceae bacterium]|nr:threonine--tRNA ligase [Bryobacteraceae bacterium]
EQWQHAENALTRAVERVGLSVKVMPDEAAFYGPKIDMKLVDAIGRKWQLSTVQFDFNLPKRFGISYIGEDGSKHEPVMVHRALFGSVERFFGILIEHYAGAFPVWLSPVQAIVLPVTDRAVEYAKGVEQQLKAAGIRCEVDDRNEKINYKIREAQLMKIPFMLVVGDREMESGAVAVRHRKHADQGAKPVAEVVAHIRQLIDSKTSQD